VDNEGGVEKEVPIETPYEKIQIEKAKKV